MKTAIERKETSGKVYRMPDKKNGRYPHYPSVSVIIPTLNSARTLNECLKSICAQLYPANRLEIVIADGGSTDGTMNIIRTISRQTAINIRVVPNMLKTGEAGKAAGFKAAHHSIAAFIDSDNILPHTNWLNRMVDPFRDPEIIASEPIEYTFRAGDGYITRYCAFIGMNDPLCLFLGNYDRYCTLTGRWTEIPHREEDKGRYLKIELDKKGFPTIGANGFLIRRAAVEQCGVGDYLFDIDVVYEVLERAEKAGEAARFAKVKTGIIHVFSGDMRTFARKQRRRIKDYLHYSRLGVRKYPWKAGNRGKLLKFILACMTVVPLLEQTIKGYRKRPNAAWFFHPLACWLTLWEYGIGSIAGFCGAGALKREGWRQ